MSTLPLGLAQLMFNAARSIGTPTDPLIELPMGLNREKTVESAQVNALKALRRFCVLCWLET